MKPPPLPRVLCVDDERPILDGLTLMLRRRYDVHIALSGEEGLQLVEHEGPFAVVLSDMRMPGMNGAQFLGRVRERAPDTVRMLLTGHTDLQSAVEAINEGRIFRFLLKPSDRLTIRGAFQDAIQQHRLASAEKVLLEQTLRGAVQAMAELMALSSPLAAARTERVRSLCQQVARQVEMGERWELDLAAMLSHIGSVTLAPETSEAYYLGLPLNEEQRAQIKALPTITTRLLEHVPRLEGVVQIIRNQKRNSSRRAKDRLSGRELDRYWGAMILKATNDFEELVARGMAPGEAINRMGNASDVYERIPIEVLTEISRQEQADRGIVEVRVVALKPGMVLAEDLHLPNGTLLVAKGCHVSPSLVAKVENLWGRMDKRRVRIAAPEAKAA